MYQSNAISLLIVLLALLPTTLIAQQDQGHQLLLNLSGSAIDENEAFDDFDLLNDTGAGQLSIVYEYSFNRILSMGLGYMNGDSDTVTSFTDLFADSELNYSSTSASVQLNLPLSKRNSLFLDVSGYDYEYEVADESIVHISQDGSDIGYTIGWRIKFNDTLGMEIEREYLPMGDDLSIKGARVRMSYSF